MKTVVADDRKFKTFYREVSASSAVSGALGPGDFDQEISSWLNNGWKLQVAHCLGVRLDGDTRLPIVSWAIALVKE